MKFLASKALFQLSKYNILNGVNTLTQQVVKISENAVNTEKS